MTGKYTEIRRERDGTRRSGVRGMEIGGEIEEYACPVDDRVLCVKYVPAYGLNVAKFVIISSMH